MRASVAISLVLIVELFQSCCGAQAANHPAEDPGKYKAEPVVIEHLDQTFRMQADGTGMLEKSVVARVQSESTLKQLAVLSLPFASNSEHVEWLSVKIVHQDGGVTETPPGSAIEVAEQVTREAPFYSDLKESQLPIRDLRVGDTLVWKARLVRTKAEAPGEFWGQEIFSRGGVVLSETFLLDVPKDKYVNVWSKGAKPTETTEGDRHLYRWTNQDKQLTVGPEADAFKEAEKKRIRTADEELDEREGRLPDLAWTTFKSWEAVGAWYRGLEGERMLPDAELKARVAQITAGKTTEEAKVEAVYSYVALQIHYIGVAFGVGRYQPHSAAEVLSNQYGDCKDKHTLLAAMLVALGLKPDAVLIGAGIRFNPALPSPAAFNHLITQVELGGKPVWLDTTAEVAPFGMLVYPIRDEQALVIPANGDAKIERTPAQPPFTQTIKMEATGTLNAEGTSISRITLAPRGDEEVALRAVVRQVSPAQYDQLAQQLCASLGYAGTASHFSSSRVDDTTTPFEVSFDYKREKSGDWPNLRVIAQLYPVMLPKPDTNDPPVESLALGVPRVETSTSTMTLPEGWEVELPNGVHEKSNWATYDLTYRFEKGVLRSERRVEILQDRVPLADWKSYDKFAEKADLGNEAFIQLIRHTGLAAKTSGGAGPLFSVPTNAATLVQKAYEAIKAKDDVGGRTLLDQARAINADQPGLWSGYGNLALLQNEMGKAIEDYQKEMKAHPKNALYGTIASTQATLYLRADAVKTLQEWADAEPANPDPLWRMTTVEFDGGNAVKAVVAAEAAIALMGKDKQPTEPQILLLGRAELKAGMKEKGEETLVAMLKTTDSASMQNDAAYELANVNIDMELADQKARAALEKEEAESRTWTLDENLATLRSKTLSLQAAWDTMGWVLFRGGKLEEAAGYIQASFDARQSAEVGLHLGEIAEKQGNAAKALADYELAIASSPKLNARGVEIPDGEVQKDLKRRVEELRSKGVHPPDESGEVALAKLRRLSLGSGADMSAEYKVLVNGSGVVRVEPTTPRQAQGAVEMLKKVKMGTFIPAGAKAQVVVKGLVNCKSGTCEFVLEQ